ncbi:hypothetical protein ACO22_02021 [Paracoccidioides brasiliensis]|uniref:Uncharacterized protein n=1 Tax=Paracoccidioides brasiliensis TaxID=121759 RepID=A0A1D2JK08_PARBR|nr:hypothetical protein ACO22_02021 [Paracoccidioides brasiliensis]
MAGQCFYSQEIVNGAAILTKEYKKLRAAVEKKKRKKQEAHTYIYIAQNGALTAEEEIASAQAIDQPVQRGLEELNQPPRERAPPRCNKCNNIEGGPLQYE